MSVARDPDTNVVGGELRPCSTAPLTGFFRDGCCNTGVDDLGLHLVCTQVTAEFLAFQREIPLTERDRSAPARRDR